MSNNNHIKLLISLIVYLFFNAMREYLPKLVTSVFAIKINI